MKKELFNTEKKAINIRSSRTKNSQFIIRNQYKHQKNPKKEKLNYTTIQLIKDLKEELTLHSEILVQIFPKRITSFIHRGADSYLSRLWWGNYKKINNIKHELKFLEPNFIFSAEEIEKIRKNLIDTLGEKKVYGGLEIIQKYEMLDISTLKFIELIEIELGRVSGVIELTNKEMGLILGGTEGFIKNILAKIRNPKLKRNYNPNYKFSKARLFEFKQILLEILEEDSKNCLEFLDKYEKLNPELKEYPQQQFTIRNPNYFDNIDSVDKSYWFGFLCADAWLRKAPDNRIGIELSFKDKEHLKKLASVLGYDINRIKERVRLFRYKGEIRKYKVVRINFGAKPMSEALERYGFRDLKANKIGIPNYVKSAVKIAKEIELQRRILWYNTLEGKIAFAWLLGFYDGDGTISGGKYAILISGNYKILEDIKNTFQIKNLIRNSFKGDSEEIEFVDIYCKNPTIIRNQVYYLNLGPKIFKLMLQSYDCSMERKRFQA